MNVWFTSSAYHVPSLSLYSHRLLHFPCKLYKMRWMNGWMDGKTRRSVVILVASFSIYPLCVVMFFGGEGGWVTDWLAEWVNERECLRSHFNFPNSNCMQSCGFYERKLWVQIDLASYTFILCNLLLCCYSCCCGCECCFVEKCSGEGNITILLSSSSGFLLLMAYL